MVIEDAPILVAGVGGVGCGWAKKAHSNCMEHADLLLVDGEDGNDDGHQAHFLRLGPESHPTGSAALPPLGEQRMRTLATLTGTVLEPVELVIILTALGGGSGSGAAPELARQAKRKGAIVLSIAALPFQCQPVRRKIADSVIGKLEQHSDVCVRLSLDRLAWQARERGVNWRLGAAWIEEFIEGLVKTVSSIGLINLDMMDLRSIVKYRGESTLLVSEGDPNDPERLFTSAMNAPLFDLHIKDAQGCLLQIEGGSGMTVSQVDSVADAFTKGLHDDAQVILGARISEELEGRMRVVAVVSGIRVPGA